MKSCVDIRIKEDNDVVTFSCMNSKPNSSDVSADGGMGLDNIRRRLELMYVDGYQLDIDDTETSFRVELIMQSL